jgi:membrane protease YdiL (CAAX protease family)
MTRLKRLFWNTEDQRLRALWRLLFQTLLLVVCVFALGAALALLTLPFGVPTGTFAPSAPPGSGSRVALGALMLGAVAASMAGAARFLDHRPFADFGFHLDAHWGADFAFGLILGTLLMGGIFLSGWALGWVEVTGTLQPASDGNAFVPSLAAALLSFICVGVYEEMIARGYHLLNVAEGFERLLGPRAALAGGCLLSSVGFGALHWGNPNASPLSTACLVLAGLLFGLAYVVTGELALPIGLHISWNFAQGNVFGFPVSGTDAGASLLSTRTPAGSPAWWTGGAFGPEAGLSGMLALLLAAGAVLLWTHRRRGTARPRLTLARYDAQQRDVQQRDA